MNIFRKLASLLVILFLLLGCVPATPTPIPTFVPSPTASPTITPTPIPPLNGIAYSPYRDCQSPDVTNQPTRDQIMQDLQIISQMANGIRTYSSTGINAEIPALARQLGLRVMVGAWLDKDKEANEKEIQGLINLANTVDLEAVIVGNEVLLRGDLTEDELISYIQRVKNAVDVPVTSAEIGGILLAHPKLMDAVDFEMVHLYPFWDGKPVENAARVVADDYHVIDSRSGGKRVVIGETGWPSGGPDNGEAIPNSENQARFAREFITLALAENIEFYYFDAFDELWKYEGGVGPYWGLLYSDRTFKYDIKSVMTPYDVDVESLSGNTASAMSTPQPTAQPDASQTKDFYVYSDLGGEANHFVPGGWMGDYQRIDLQCSREGLAWPKTMLQISYAPGQEDVNGWAGVYWLQPDQNWGTIPDAGYELSAYKQLVFQARTNIPGTQFKFFLGGISSSPEGTPLPYPSSVTQPVFAQEADPVDGFINLTDSWQEYHFDLTGLDLHYVIDGFGWAAERTRTPEGAIVYLDNIRFVTEEANPAPVPPIHIYNGQFFRSGLDMGIASSGGLTDLVEDQTGVMKVTYPDSQTWGVVFITAGEPAPRGKRSSLDVSQYGILRLEMRGEYGGEEVYIGIKDKYQPDDGTEITIPVTLTSEWETYTFDLSRFGFLSLKDIYIPIEFVFHQRVAKTIYFRNIQYLPSE